MEGGPKHVTHGMPQRSIGQREDTGEGMRAGLTDFTNAERMATMNLTNKQMNVGPDEPGPAMTGGEGNLGYFQ
jgi:hypothetical protein